MMLGMFRKLAAFFLGLILLFAFAEIAMRMTASLRNLSVEDRSLVAGSENGERPFKIVVLGESTSASWKRPDDPAWPGRLQVHLQKYFDEKGIKRKLQVTNLARSGVSSTLLVDHFVEFLETETPDVLITMMGINDTVALQSERSFLLSNSYFVRMLYWSYVSIRCPGCYRISNDFVEDDLVEKEALTLASLISEIEKRSLLTIEDVERANNEYLSFKKVEAPKISPPHENQDVELDIMWASWLFAASDKPALHHKKYGPVRRALWLLAKDYFESARRAVAKKKGSTKQYCFVLLRLREGARCLDVIKESLREGVKLTSDLFVLAVAVGAADDLSLKKIIEYHGYSIHKNRQAISATIESYQRLLALQRRFGFRWFAMQYPRGSVEGLRLLLRPEESGAGRIRSMNGFGDIFNFGVTQKDEVPEFKPLHGVELVSNENFRTVVSKENEPEYFIDLFARTSGANFGHTTEKGHELIAQNIFAALIEHLDFDDPKK